MKKLKLIFMLVLSMLIIASVAACAVEGGDSSSGSSSQSSSQSDSQSSTQDSTSESDNPTDVKKIGVVFGDGLEETELIEIDYKNALAGLLFFDKDSTDMLPIDLSLTSLTINGEVVGEANYQYESGILEFTEEYLKSLTLESTYAVKAEFGDNSVQFTIKITDGADPAFKYLVDALLNDVYLSGDEIKLPIASKSPSSIQNISASYALTDENGEEITYSDNKFTAQVGKYAYTATFMKNGSVCSTNKKEFTVIDLSNANLADKDCAIVLGGTYSEDEQAALFTGENTLGQIEVDSAYKYVRLNFKGEGTVTFDENVTNLSSENYTTMRFSVTDFNTVKINSQTGLYVKSLELSQISAFTKEDIETLDFADEEFLSLWGYNETYGTPTFDSELDGISFEGTGNSWPYTLRQGIIKTAYDNGYNYLVITYTGKGTTRVYNDETGDWGGYGKDLSEATARRVAYNLTETAKKAEINETSGFSVITDADALVLTEFRFYKTDVVVEEEGIYNTMNLVESSLVDKWSHNQDVAAATYDENEQALAFPANGNYDTFNFEHDALRKAQKKGYNAIEFTVKGSAGMITLFVDQNWGMDAKYSVKTGGEYAQGIIYFGDLIFNEKSGIAVLSSNDNGGEPVLIKEMRFITAQPEAETDYTVLNLASKELVDDWYYNESSGVKPYYDETEGALVLPSNGNYDTYTFSNKAVKAAKDKGKNAITFTVKGKNASVSVFVNGSWSTDAVYNVNSEEAYTTFTMHFAHLNVTDESGITILVSDAVGGTSLYVKELKFDKITVDETVLKLMSGNIVSKENVNLWVSNGSGDAVSYDDENGCMKFEFTKASSIKLNVEKLFEYAKLFGKTKIVWNRVSSGTDESGKELDYYGRLRLYADDGKFTSGTKNDCEQNVNILGSKVGDNRVFEIDITAATDSFVFAIANQKDANTTVTISELYFA